MPREGELAASRAVDGEEGDEDFSPTAFSVCFSAYSSSLASSLTAIADCASDAAVAALPQLRLTPTITAGLESETRALAELGDGASVRLAKLLLAVIAASEKNIDAQQRDNLGLAAGGGGGNSKTKRTNSST